MINLFLPSLYFLGFILFLVTSNSLIEFLLLNSFIGKRYRLFVAPGVFIHELSHAIAVLITGNKIKEFNVTDSKGGYVIYTKTNNNLSQILISFAPIMGLSLAFVLTIKFLAPELIFLKSGDYRSFWSEFSINKWQTWLFFYLTLSFSTSVTPSKQDFKVALPGLIIMLIFLVFLSFLPINLHQLIIKIIPLAMLIIFFILLSLSLSLILYLISKGLEKQKNH
jgi:hypothetical protein